jgi:hypothetical protein
VDWIGLVQVRDKLRAQVNATMNHRVPQNAEKLPSGCTTCGLSRSVQLHAAGCNHSNLRSYNRGRSYNMKHILSEHRVISLVLEDV